MSTETQTDLTTITVNMTNDSMRALTETADRLGDTKTETINRAVQLYAKLTALDLGQSMTFANRAGEPFTVGRVETPEAARQALREAL
jgi:hypothetical protein